MFIAYDSLSWHIRFCIVGAISPVTQRAPRTSSEDGVTSEDGHAHITHPSQYMRLAPDRYTYCTADTYITHTTDTYLAASICVGGGAVGSCGRRRKLLHIHVQYSTYTCTLQVHLHLIYILQRAYSSAAALSAAALSTRGCAAAA